MYDLHDFVCTFFKEKIYMISFFILFVRHGHSMGFKGVFVFLLCLQEDLFWS